MAEAKVIAELTYNDQAIGFTLEDVRLLLAQMTGEQLLEALPDHPDLRVLAVTNVPISTADESFTAPLIVLERGMPARMRTHLFSVLAAGLQTSEHDGALPDTTVLVTR